MARAGLNPSPGPEDRFVRGLVRGLPVDHRVVLGAGDDCAAIRIPGSRDLLLLKTDCVVEGIHFEPGFPAARVGRKAMNRFLSDIAAMGGRPAQALVTVFSPSQTPQAYWSGVYRGLRGAAREHGVSIVGGETSRASVIALSIAGTGTVVPTHMVSRSQGRPGDDLFVTGTLGGSLSRKHWAFQPRLAQGQWLAKLGFARAMMDLSDGLASDLPRLASASGCGFSVVASQVPRSQGCDLHAALSDGEDYELLFACPSGRTEALRSDWAKTFPKLRLSPIGVLTRPGKGQGFGIAGLHGYDHLASPHKEC